MGFGAGLLFMEWYSFFLLQRLHPHSRQVRLSLMGQLQLISNDQKPAREKRKSDCRLSLCKRELSITLTGSNFTATKSPGGELPGMKSQYGFVLVCAAVSSDAVNQLFFCWSVFVPVFNLQWHTVLRWLRWKTSLQVFTAGKSQAVALQTCYTFSPQAQWT